MVTYSDIGGVENKMTDDLKVKASKAVDDAHVAAHAAYDDASVAVNNALKGKSDAQNVSDDIKMQMLKLLHTGQYQN
jgi:tRNA threonylcarbamoyladenosine modification (KEOPS) complex Cgi121 subunit